MSTQGFEHNGIFLIVSPLYAKIMNRILWGKRKRSTFYLFTAMNLWFTQMGCLVHVWVLPATMIVLWENLEP